MSQPKLTQEVLDTLTDYSQVLLEDNPSLQDEVRAISVMMRQLQADGTLPTPVEAEAYRQLVNALQALCEMPDERLALIAIHGKQGESPVHTLASSLVSGLIVMRR